MKTLMIYVLQKSFIVGLMSNLKWVQDALYENSDDPASVVRVIDLYKVDKGLTKTAKKAKAKDAASTVTKRSKTQVDVEDANDVIRESEVAKMSDKEFEENLTKLTKLSVRVNLFTMYLAKLDKNC